VGRGHGECLYLRDRRYGFYRDARDGVNVGARACPMLRQS